LEEGSKYDKYGITIGSTRTTTTTIAIVAIGIITTIILTIMMMTIPSFTTAIAQQGNRTEPQQDTEFRVQNTTMSIPAPNAKLNNQTINFDHIYM
jgi:hypothetical protein